MQLALARGQSDLAAEIEHDELSRALATARLSAPDAVDEAALFARELERVETAVLTAELLAPLLAEQLRPIIEQAREREATAHPSARPDFSRHSPPPSASTPRSSDSPPQIADLIEGMLAQQRPPAASRRS